LSYAPGLPNSLPVLLLRAMLHFRFRTPTPQRYARHPMTTPDTAEARPCGSQPNRQAIFLSSPTTTGSKQRKSKAKCTTSVPGTIPREPCNGTSDTSTMPLLKAYLLSQDLTSRADLTRISRSTHVIQGSGPRT